MSNEEARKAYNEGLDLAVVENYAEARERFRHAASLDAEDADALSDLGRIEIETQRLAAAQEALDEALNRRPDHPGAWNNRGVVHFLKKEYESAEKAFSSAVNLNVDLAEAWFNLADTRDVLGDKDGAKTARSHYEALKKGQS